MKTVAIVLYPDFLLLDMAGPAEVFSIANRYLAVEDHYRICMLGATAGLYRASNGTSMLVEMTLEQAGEPYDVVLIPGGPGAYNERHRPLEAWLQSAAQSAMRFGSICTGAFVLGHAGLLDGHRVTTHWHYTERLVKAFPRARVETDQILVQDGKLLTSGGITAGIDLALAIVAEDHGRKLALDVAKVLLVVMKRQGGQSQFSPLAAAVAPQETAITRVQNYLLDHLEESFSIERMAALAAMSERHFTRLFVREVQLTPMVFLQNARIDRARGLLESTDLPLKTVAYRSGFGSVRHMRVLFCEKLGLGPVQYRQQFS